MNCSEGLPGLGDVSSGSESYNTTYHHVVPHDQHSSHAHKALSVHHLHTSCLNPLTSSSISIKGLRAGTLQSLPHVQPKELLQDQRVQTLPSYHCPPTCCHHTNSHLQPHCTRAPTPAVGSRACTLPHILHSCRITPHPPHLLARVPTTRCPSTHIRGSGLELHWRSLTPGLALKRRITTALDKSAHEKRARRNRLKNARMSQPVCLEQC